MNNFVLSGALFGLTGKYIWKILHKKSIMCLGYTDHLPIFIRVTYLQAQVL